jgi:hypothetical protein
MTATEAVVAGVCASTAVHDDHHWVRDVDQQVCHCRGRSDVKGELRLRYDEWVTDRWRQSLRDYDDTNAVNRSDDEAVALMHDLASLVWPVTPEDEASIAALDALPRVRYGFRTEDVRQLAARNGAVLLAGQVQGLERDREEQDKHHRDQLQQLRTTLDEAQAIGAKVLAAHRAGRKTVKVADVIGEA